ncbi:hypothetical protein ACYX34_09280, partial [Nitrospira sp. CMX1]
MLTRKIQRDFRAGVFNTWAGNLLPIFVAIMWCSSPAFAQIPRIQGQGAPASGMGNAFAAQADNPSALYYNPAGMTQLRG